MKYFFLSLLFTTIGYAQQNIIVKYNFHNSSVFENTPNDEAQKMLKKTLELANNQKFELIFSENRASFKLMDQLSVGEEDNLTNLTRLAFTSPDIYTNLDAKIQITVNDGTLVESKINNLNWEITSESKTIGTYLCYKAILNKPFIARNGENKINKIVAWFAPSLPYGVGPKHFCGLPGLILEVTEYSKTFLASKIEFIDKEIDLKFPKGKTIVKEEFDKKMNSGGANELLLKKRAKE